VLASSCPILHSWLALLPPKNLIQRDVRHFSFSTFPSLSLSLFLFSSWSCSNYSSSSSSTSQTCAQKVSQICTHKRVMRYADNVGETSLRRDNLPNNSAATNEISLLCNTQGNAFPSLCNAMHRNPNPNFFRGREPKTRKE
jgi:hypothetical protein